MGLKRKASPIEGHNEGHNVPRRWSQLSYAGEQRVPPSVERNGGSWATFFLGRNDRGQFTDAQGHPVAFAIKQPDSIDFAGEQLARVQATLENLTPEQITIAEYWNAGPPTKQIAPIADRLIDTYGVSANRAARVLAALHGALNDATVVTWHFKYAWEVARPNQLDQTLATILCTPHHPSYPAGHGATAGCMAEVLSYFFAAETERLNALAEECAISRVYGGVHYPADVEQGLRLGHQVGRIAVAALQAQNDQDQAAIDNPITDSRHADLPPPPYKQVIPFKRSRSCSSLLDGRHDPDAE